MPLKLTYPRRDLSPPPVFLEGAFTTRRSVLLFLAVWILSGAYMAVNLNRGWVPHDEGILAQAAERVVQGEMPHRDFEDPYTGGLSYLHAAAFRLFGVDLLVLRYVLFAFFLAWVLAVYAAAREFSEPWPAAGITILGVAWSVPNYAAAIPSWFCLFLATFGTLALLKYIRKPRTYLLVLAGLCGGFSFLVKSPGLYFVAGALLFFVYREQTLSAQNEVPSQPAATYRWFIFLCLTAFVIMLTRLVLSSGGAPEFFHFVLPQLAIVSLLVFRECGTSRAPSSVRFKLLFRMTIPFLCCAAIPVILFFAFYWSHHAIHQLTNSLFVLHLQRLLHARRQPPSATVAIPSIVLALLLTEKQRSGDFRLFASAIKILFATLLLVSCFRFRLVYLVVLQVVWGAIPVLIVAAVALLWHRSRQRESLSRLDQQITLLLSVTALFSLLQFPFAYPIYFCYVAPLTILAVAAVLSARAPLPRLNIYCAAVFLGLFAILVFRPGFLSYMPYGYHPDEQTVPLALPRATGLRVSLHDAAEYQELIPFVQKLAAGRSVLAAPECPEVYFLSQLRNPTGILFDFFHQPHEYQAQIQAILDRPDFIRVVVLFEAPEFSSEQLNVLQTLVRPRFPRSRTIGNFEVFWRP